jgi:integrase
MATIEKRSRDGSVSYLVRWRDPARKQRSKAFAKRKDAVTYLTTVTGEIQAGAYIDPRAGKVTLADLWDQWWPTVVLGPNSRERDTLTFKNHVRPAFGDVRLNRLERPEIAEWVAKLSKSGKGPATVHKAHQVLSKTLDEAVERRLIRSNPARGVDLPPIVQRKPRVISVGQVTKLATVIEERFRLFVLIACYCGLRGGELAGLCWGRVDLDAQVLDVAEQVIAPKGHVEITDTLKTRAAYRRVPIPRFVCDALRDAKGEAGPDDLIFPDSLGGPLRIDNFRNRVWNGAVKLAGLPRGFLIHECRHTAVSLWIAAGATPVQVKTWAGHASVASVFDLYGHLFDDHGQEIADRLHKMANPARRSRRQPRKV